jgi:hypothetical protein
MSAVLRAYGLEFDGDVFAVDCTLPICAIKRRGEPVFPASQPDGRRHESSGVHILVSDADFDEFQSQVDDAISFLQGNELQLRRLAEWPGVEVELDFGIERRDVILECNTSPAELLRLAGALRIDITISHYPNRNKSD